MLQVLSFKNTPFIHFYLCVRASVYICVPSTQRRPNRPEEGVIAPRSGVTGCCVPPCRCLDLNLASLKEQWVLLTAEQSSWASSSLLLSLLAQVSPTPLLFSFSVGCFTVHTLLTLHVSSQPSFRHAKPFVPITCLLRVQSVGDRPLICHLISSFSSDLILPKLLLWNIALSRQRCVVIFVYTAFA